MAKKTPSQRKKKSAQPITPVPEGFHTVTPYLVISGAVQALEFYRKAFGAKVITRQALPDGKLLHGRIKIGDSLVMMSDEFPGGYARSPTTLGGSTFSLHIYTRNVDKLWQQAVSAGAKVVMPLDNQFWGERYGILTDLFGHNWSMSMRVKMSPKEMEAKRKAAMAMFQQGEHPSKQS